MLVVLIGGVLLLVGVALQFLTSRQRESLELTTNSEVAHLLAEAGIEASIRSVKDALKNAGVGGGRSDPLPGLLLVPGPRSDCSLMPYLGDTWNDELDEYARQLDPSARVRVEVWLREFRLTETDPAAWVDPVAKTGFLCIESTGSYRGMKRTLSVRRQIWVGSILPPVYSRFTLHVKDAARGDPGRFNVIRSDYDSTISDGPRPLICYHQATPELGWGNPDDPRLPDVGERRGQVYLGGGRIRLQLTSGAGPMGEIFQLYDIPNPGTFQAIKFRTPPETLTGPLATGDPIDMVRDDTTDASLPKLAKFRFAHSFVLEGFHDRSSRKSENAMYEGGILSSQERIRYGAKASMLHLFGDGRPGYRSHTRVFGQVDLALIKFCQLEVIPEDADSKAGLARLSPPPIYLLPSLTAARFTSDLVLHEFQGRRWLGPLIIARQLFGTYEEYEKLMSCIIVHPYMVSYNSMAEIAAGVADRQFPPKTTIFGQDPGTAIKIANGGAVLYEGPAEPAQALAVMKARSQQTYPDVASFWAAVDPDKKGEAVIGGVVRIANPDKVDLVLPPRGLPPPLKVVDGGMILLEQGNVVLRGVQVADPKEALTIVAEQGSRVMIESGNNNCVNLVIPRGALGAFGTPVRLIGTLACSDLVPGDLVHGGVLQYRPEQDPTTLSPSGFRKIRVGDADVFWHE